MRSSCSAPQNMNSAMNTTSSTTTPVGSLSHWSSVKRPMYDEYQKSSNSPTVSPKAKMPNSTPSTKNSPSSLPVEAETSDVPGQKPPTMKPTPMISPPTMPGHR